MRMDDNADAKRILLASPPADWRRQLGRPRITCLSTIQQDVNVNVNVDLYTASSQKAPQMRL